MNSAVCIGYCRTCRARVRLTVEYETHEVWWGGKRSVEYYWHMLGKRWFGTSDQFRPVCLCGKEAIFDRIQGRAGKQKCGARCQSATGPSCECQCKGENHGAAFAA